jgi:hypothetical protein
MNRFVESKKIRPPFFFHYNCFLVFEFHRTIRILCKKTHGTIVFLGAVANAPALGGELFILFPVLDLE